MNCSCVRSAQVSRKQEGNYIIPRLGHMPYPAARSTSDNVLRLNLPCPVPIRGRPCCHQVVVATQALDSTAGGLQCNQVGQTVCVNDIVLSCAVLHTAAELSSGCLSGTVAVELNLDDTFLGLQHYPLPTLLPFCRSIWGIFQVTSSAWCNENRPGCDGRLAGEATAVQT
jgi:hypothetical protein